MHDLSGAVAVVTGAGRGLGAALAIALADSGARPILCGRSLSGLRQTASSIAGRTGYEPATVELDLADTGSVRRAAEAISSRETAVDLLVNNAAMWLEARSAPYSEEEVLGVVNTAVSGTFLLTQALLPALSRSRRPDVVTIGSVSGLPNAALQTVSLPFYAAKSGQKAMAEGLQQIFSGTPVRSISIHPPYLDDMLPGEEAWEAAATRQKGRRGTNRDIVDAVLFAVTRPRHVTLSIIVDADNGGLFPAR